MSTETETETVKTVKTVITFEHEGSAEAFQDLLCRVIHEGDMEALTTLQDMVLDISAPNEPLAEA